MYKRQEYNRLDRAFISIRIPFELENETIFPGKIGFLIDHILGPKYDRMMNELFIIAFKQGQFEQLASDITLLLRTHDIEFSRLVKSTPASAATYDFSQLADKIECLYADRSPVDSVQDLLPVADRLLKSQRE